jgi:hypothetical protein
MKDVKLAEGEVPTQDWKADDDKGLVERMNEIFGDDAGELGENIRTDGSKADEAGKETKPEEKESEGKEPEKDDEIIEEGLTTEEEKEDGKEEDEGKIPETDALDEEEFDRETEELAKGMAKKAGARFKELRGELKEAKKKLVLAESDERIPDSVKEKLEEAELKARKAADLEKQFEELRNTSAKVRLESSDDYKRQVVQPVAGIIRRIESIAAANEIDSGLLQEIVREQNVKTQNNLISEHLADFSERDRAAIYNLSEKFADVVEIRNSMMADAGKAIEKMEAERIDRENQQAEERKGIYRTLQKDLWEKYADRIPGLSDEDGVPTETFDALRAKGLNYDFGKAGEKDMAYAAFAGVLLPHVVKELAKLRRELDSVDGKASKEKRSAPSMGDGERQENTEGSDGEGFLERMSKMRF